MSARYLLLRNDPANLASPELWLDVADADEVWVALVVSFDGLAQFDATGENAGPSLLDIRAAAHADPPPSGAPALVGVDYEDTEPRGLNVSVGAAGYEESLAATIADGHAYTILLHLENTSGTSWSAELEIDGDPYGPVIGTSPGGSDAVRSITLTAVGGHGDTEIRIESVTVGTTGAGSADLLDVDYTATATVEDGWDDHEAGDGTLEIVTVAEEPVPTSTRLMQYPSPTMWPGDDLFPAPDFAPRPAVTLPHFAYPFAFGAAGADVTEQNSAKEILDCARAILACPLGARVELPAFGVDDQAFRARPDREALAGALAEWEPRVLSHVDVTPDVIDALISHVGARLTPRSED